MLTPTERQLIDELKAAEAKATPGAWRAGRDDMLSYHADGTGPYKNVYVDNPNGCLHMGERLPDTVCEVMEALDVDCRDTAKFIALARNTLPALLGIIERLAGEVEELTRLRAELAELRAENQ